MGCSIKTRIGGKYINNKGEYFTVIDYINVNNCTVRFDDGTIVENIFYNTIKRGAVKNPNTPTVYGVGYFGQGKYSKTRKIYSTWISMLQRCYSVNRLKENPSYVDIFVCKEWKCFQKFAEWYTNNYKEGFHLDKDILVKNNKIYSPETCCFVPSEVNNLLTICTKSRGIYPLGVSITKCGKYSATHKKKKLGTFNTPEEAFQAYKAVKELWIKEVANKWRDKITEKCYSALINWIIAITD
jgi:hypothetical protein